MATDRKLPRLLGSEPEIKLNEIDIQAKINANFHDGLEKSNSYYNNSDKLNFYDYKKASGNESRLVKLNSADVYEITGRGRIRAIHSNETITTAKAKSIRSRPRSSKYVSKRPWSNRSYRRGKSGSSNDARQISSKRTIFCANNNNSVNSHNGNNSNKVTSHLSRVDNIIGQVDKYSRYEQNPNQKMTKKYCRLRTQDNIEGSLGVYGTKTQQVRQKTQSSVRSLSGPRIVNQTIKVFKAPNSKTINGISVTLLTQLFNAKCRDLELHPKEGQLRRFYDFCNNAIIGRKLIFKEIGLGFNSAKVLGQILRLNTFSHLDLRKNVLGNKGLKELAKSILTNSSLIHVDIGSNDITFEGANSFFISMRKHKTLSSINVANSDGLHRNRIGPKG